MQERAAEKMAAAVLGDETRRSWDAHAIVVAACLGNEALAAEVEAEAATQSAEAWLDHLKDAERSASKKL